MTANGRITALDATWVLQSCAGLRDLKDDEKRIADMNGDGEVTPHDALSILKFVVGLGKSMYPMNETKGESANSSPSETVEASRKIPVDPKGERP